VDVDFVKVDTQGSELPILKGAGDYLTESNIGIEVEVEFLPLYQGQPLFADVDIFLRAQGYELFDLSRHFWRRTGTPGDKGCFRGQLVYADALYFVSAERFESVLANYQDEQARTEKFIRAIAVILIYGYYDYALHLCERVSCVNAQAVEIIKLTIKKHLDRQFMFPQVRGRTRLALMLEKISESIRYSLFNADDKKLGN
jgi:hypothetical protein